MQPEELVPVVAAIGFGIQQFLQVVVDPVVSVIITVWKNSKHGVQQADGTRSLPNGITDVDAKKALLGLTSFGLGLIIASTGKIQVLAAYQITLPGWDTFITALTISAGTEGLNSAVKLVQYVKDAVKARTPPSVSLNSPAPQSPNQPNPTPPPPQ